MGLEHIQLPSIVLRDLFKYSLVEIRDDQSTKSPPATGKGFKILGNNNKNILILVSDHENAFLPDDQLNFLLGILSACKLTNG